MRKQQQPRDRRGRYARGKTPTPVAIPETGSGRQPVQTPPDYLEMAARVHKCRQTPEGLERAGHWIVENTTTEYEVGVYRTGRWLRGEGLPPTRADRNETRDWLNEWMEPEGSSGTDIYHRDAVDVWRELDVLDAMEDNPNLDADAARVMVALGATPEQQVSERRRERCEEADEAANLWAELDVPEQFLR